MTKLLLGLTVAMTLSSTAYGRTLVTKQDLFTHESASAKTTVVYRRDYLGGAEEHHAEKCYISTKSHRDNRDESLIQYWYQWDIDNSKYVRNLALVIYNTHKDLSGTTKAVIDGGMLSPKRSLEVGVASKGMIYVENKTGNFDKNSYGEYISALIGFGGALYIYEGMAGRKVTTIIEPDARPVFDNCIAEIDQKIAAKSKK